MTLRLYDTATRTVRDFVPLRTRPGLDLRLRRDRAGRAAHRAPAVGPELRHPAPLAELRAATTSRMVRNVTDIDDKIIAKAAEAGRPWWAHAAIFEQAFRDGYADPGLPAADRRAAGDRPHHRDDHPDAAADRRRPRLPGRRRRLLRRPVLPGLRRAVRAADRRDAAGRRLGRRCPQARPARLCPVEVGQTRRAELADAVGRRPSGLAPGVLGDGRQVPGRGLRHPRRRPGSDLPAPRERDGPVGGGRRRVRPVLDAQRLGHHGRREDVEVAGQHRLDRRDGQAVAAGRAAVLPGCGALPLGDRVLAGGAGRGGGRPTPRSRTSCSARSSWSASRSSGTASCRPSSSRRWTTTSNVPQALAVLHNARRAGNAALAAGDKAEVARGAGARCWR